MLSELRASILTALEGAGIKALEYLGESISPPCDVVVPAEPYFQTAAGTDGARPIPFRKVLVGVDVLMLVPRADSAKAEAKAIDDQIESTYQALNPLDTITIRRVSRPGVVTVSGSKFIGSVLSIEALSEEP